MTYGKPEDFKEIAVSSTMVTDHLPGNYYREIFAIVRKKLHLL